MRAVKGKNRTENREIKVNKKRYFGILALGICALSIVLYQIVWPRFPQISEKDMLCVFALLWLLLSHLAIRCSRR